MGKIFAVVSIDTDALTYAHCYKDDDNADDKLLGLKVRHYLKSASQKNTQVVLPIVVLSEYLCRYDQIEYDRIIAELDQDFILGEFNYLAAKELAIMRRNKQLLKESRQKTNQPKNSIKYDQFIAAISIAAGATQIHTGNSKDYDGLTAGKLKIIDIRQLIMPAIPQSLPGCE